MSDLERLDEAFGVIEMCELGGGDGPFDRMPEAIHEIKAAARAYRDLLANGQRVEWCEEHKTSAAPGSRCAEWLLRNHAGIRPGEDCRIVSKLLSVYPKEAENE